MLPEALQAYRAANRFKDNFQCHYLSGVIFDKLEEFNPLRYVRGCSEFAGFPRGSFARQSIERIPSQRHVMADN